MKLPLTVTKSIDGTPRIVDADGVLAEMVEEDGLYDYESDAAFICKAVNHHDELVAVLSQLLNCTELNTDDLTENAAALIGDARAALAKLK